MEAVGVITLNDSHGLMLAAASPQTYIDGHVEIPYAVSRGQHVYVAIFMEHTHTWFEHVTAWLEHYRQTHLLASIFLARQTDNQQSCRQTRVVERRCSIR